MAETSLFLEDQSLQDIEKTDDVNNTAYTTFLTSPVGTETTPSNSIDIIKNLTVTTEDKGDILKDVPDADKVLYKNLSRLLYIKYSKQFNKEQLDCLKQTLEFIDELFSKLDTYNKETVPQMIKDKNNTLLHIAKSLIIDLYHTILIFIYYIQNSEFMLSFLTNILKHFKNVQSKLTALLKKLENEDTDITAYLQVLDDIIKITDSHNIDNYTTCITECIKKYGIDDKIHTIQYPKLFEILPMRVIGEYSIQDDKCFYDELNEKYKNEDFSMMRNHKDIDNLLASMISTIKDADGKSTTSTDENELIEPIKSISTHLSEINDSRDVKTIMAKYKKKSELAESPNIELIEFILKSAISKSSLTTNLKYRVEHTAKYYFKKQFNDYVKYGQISFLTYYLELYLNKLYSDFIKVYRNKIVVLFQLTPSSNITFYEYILLRNNPYKGLIIDSAIVAALVNYAFYQKQQIVDLNNLYESLADEKIEYLLNSKVEYTHYGINFNNAVFNKINDILLQNNIVNNIEFTNKCINFFQKYYLYRLNNLSDLLDSSNMLSIFNLDLPEHIKPIEKLLFFILCLTLYIPSKILIKDYSHEKFGEFIKLNMPSIIKLLENITTYSLGKYTIGGSNISKCNNIKHIIASSNEYCNNKYYGGDPIERFTNSLVSVPTVILDFNFGNITDKHHSTEELDILSIETNPDIDKCKKNMLVLMCDLLLCHIYVKQYIHTKFIGDHTSDDILLYNLYKKINNTIITVLHYFYYLHKVYYTQPNFNTLNHFKNNKAAIFHNYEKLNTLVDSFKKHLIKDRKKLSTPTKDLYISFISTLLSTTFTNMYNLVSKLLISCLNLQDFSNSQENYEESITTKIKQLIESINTMLRNIKNIRNKLFDRLTSINDDIKSATLQLVKLIYFFIGIIFITDINILKLKNTVYSEIDKLYIEIKHNNKSMKPISSSIGINNPSLHSLKLFINTFFNGSIPHEIENMICDNLSYFIQTIVVDNPNKIDSKSVELAVSELYTSLKTQDESITTIDNYSMKLNNTDVDFFINKIISSITQHGGKWFYNKIKGGDSHVEPDIFDSVTEDSVKTIILRYINLVYISSNKLSIENLKFVGIASMYPIVSFDKFMFELERNKFTESLQFLQYLLLKFIGATNYESLAAVFVINNFHTYNYRNYHTLLNIYQFYNSVIPMMVAIFSYHEEKYAKADKYNQDKLEIVRMEQFKQRKVIFLQRAKDLLGLVEGEEIVYNKELYTKILGIFTKSLLHPIQDKTKKTALHNRIHQKLLRYDFDKKYELLKFTSQTMIELIAADLELGFLIDEIRRMYSSKKIKWDILLENLAVLQGLAILSKKRCEDVVKILRNGLNEKFSAITKLRTQAMFGSI